MAADDAKKFEAEHSFGEVINGKINFIGVKKLEKAGKAREGAVRLPLLLIKGIALVSLVPLVEFCYGIFFNDWWQ